MSGFVKQMDHAVDHMTGGFEKASFDEVKRILADLRKQYDDVHFEAGKREQDLLVLRKKMQLMEVERKTDPDTWGDLTREEVLSRLATVSKETKVALETKGVYQHLANRLKQELSIVKHKVKFMEEHLKRKASELEKKQASMRRLQEEKVACINKLESLEMAAEVECSACAGALEDMEATSRLKQEEVKHRGDFERWRFDVASEAAGEAFQATAGRFWKIYAVEKLVGNCLQKIGFEQLEQSHVTEEAFQKIREVTGLTDVMDIVHKFLNRDVEQEQLQAAVSEAESRLLDLKKEEDALKTQPAALLDLMLESTTAQDPLPVMSTRLYADVTEQQDNLAAVMQNQEDLQKQLQSGNILFEDLRLWTERMSRSVTSITPFEPLRPVECPEELPDFFAEMADAVDSLLDQARAEQPMAKIVRVACQVEEKERAEQMHMLEDKELMKANCRVPASLDHPFAEDLRRAHSAVYRARAEEEEQKDFAHERERMKGESFKLAGIRDPREQHSARRRPGNGRRTSQALTTDTGRSTFVSEATLRPFVGE